MYPNFYHVDFNILYRAIVRENVDFDGDENADFDGDEMDWDEMDWDELGHPDIMLDRCNISTSSKPTWIEHKYRNPRKTMTVVMARSLKFQPEGSLCESININMNVDFPTAAELRNDVAVDVDKRRKSKASDAAIQTLLLKRMKEAIIKGEKDIFCGDIHISKVLEVQMRWYGYGFDHYNGKCCYMSWLKDHF